MKINDDLTIMADEIPSTFTEIVPYSTDKILRDSIVLLVGLFCLFMCIWGCKRLSAGRISKCCKPKPRTVTLVPVTAGRDDMIVRPQFIQASCPTYEEILRII